MKKFTFWAAIVACVVACGTGANYTITGTVEAAADGDTIYLKSVSGMQSDVIDMAVVRDGKFTMKGNADSITHAYISYATDEKGYSVDFFLEPGEITVDIPIEETARQAIGTPSNDIYQSIREKLNALMTNYYAAMEMMNDSTISADERKERFNTATAEIQNELMAVYKASVRENIGNVVGVTLFKQLFSSNSTAENDSLLQQIPEAFQNDPEIVYFREQTAKQKGTAEGTHFIDFEMDNLDGKPVKLSDYAGRGKLVLVDFWASWCGPCVAEMPTLVQAYAKYRDRGFEIVGVSLDRTADAWRAKVKELHMTWPQMSDLKFWQCEGVKLYAVNSIPHTVLIDGEGTIIARKLRGEELLSKLEELLGK